MVEQAGDAVFQPSNGLKKYHAWCESSNGVSHIWYFEAIHNGEGIALTIHFFKGVDPYGSSTVDDAHPISSCCCIHEKNAGARIEAVCMKKQGGEIKERVKG